MSKWQGRDEKCPHCGTTYEVFKTGLGFSDVRQMLWVGDPDYAKWKYKRRHTVLGLWHKIKLSMWEEHLLMCEMTAEYRAKAAQLGYLEREPGSDDLDFIEAFESDRRAVGEEEATPF